MPKQTVDSLGAEARAVEAGLRAYSNGDGTFRVRSSTRPTQWWTVEIAAVRMPEGWRLRMACTCEGGSSRPGEFVACLHGAAVGRSLERRGFAKWVGGLWEPDMDLLRGAA